MLIAAIAAAVLAATTVPPDEPDTSEVEAAAVTAFAEWTVDTLGVEVVDPECLIIEAPNILCFGETDDGRSVGAEAAIDPSGEYQDGFDLDPASDFTVDYGTAISDAVLECEQVEYTHEDAAEAQRFFVMDEGHSVRIEDFADESDNTLSAPRVECMTGQLRMPEWMFVEMAMMETGSIDVPGYTISWAYSGESAFASDFLIYDSEVGGGI